MKSLLVVMILIVLIVVVWSVWGWYMSRVEQPTFTVEKHYNGFTVVRTPPVITASVVVTGNLREASSQAFRELAGFIFGDNTSVSKIAMTAPVISQQAPSDTIAMTAPVISQSSTKDTYIVSFTMPDTWSMETLPVPNNNRINIVEQPTMRKAIWTFGGYAGEARVARERQAFEAALLEEKISWTGTYLLAQYNDPLTPPWMRKNELRVELGLID